MPDRQTPGEDAVRRMRFEHEQEVVARMVPRQRIPEALFISDDEAAAARPDVENE